MEPMVQSGGCPQDGWLAGCLTSQQHASVSQGRICSDNCTRCHNEIEVADQTFNLTQSRYTDTGPTSPSTDPITPGAWQGSHCMPILSHWYDSTPKIPNASGIQTRDLPLSRWTPYPLGQRGGSHWCTCLEAGVEPRSTVVEADAFTTRPTRRKTLAMCVTRGGPQPSSGWSSQPALP